jgi:hypothetical protein
LDNNEKPSNKILIVTFCPIKIVTLCPVTFCPFTVSDKVIFMCMNESVSLDHIIQMWFIKYSDFSRNKLLSIANIN